MANDTARRYQFLAIHRATRWVNLRIYGGKQSEASSTNFLRCLHATAPNDLHYDMDWMHRWCMRARSWVPIRWLVRPT